MPREWLSPICWLTLPALLLASSPAGGWAFAQFVNDHFGVDLRCEHQQNKSHRYQLAMEANAYLPAGQSNPLDDNVLADPEEEDPCHSCPTCPGGDSGCYSI